MSFPVKSLSLAYCVQCHELFKHRIQCYHSQFHWRLQGLQHQTAFEELVDYCGSLCVSQHKLKEPDRLQGYQHHCILRDPPASPTLKIEREHADTNTLLCT